MLQTLRGNIADQPTTEQPRKAGRAANPLLSNLVRQSERLVTGPDLPLYIDEWLQSIETPTIDQIKFISRFYLMH
jgi:hypothetical protein